MVFVRPFQNHAKQNNFQMKIVVATGGTVGLLNFNFEMVEQGGWWVTELDRLVITIIVYTIFSDNVYIAINRIKLLH